MAKLKYGLKKSLQKETNRLASFDVAYDEEDDSLLIAVALRDDLKHAELLDRIKECLVRSVDEIKKKV